MASQPGPLDESEPFGLSEQLLRRFSASGKRPSVVPISAFFPRPADTDGLSLFRAACLNHPGEIVARLDPNRKPDSYRIASVPGESLGSSMTFQLQPIGGTPGHGVIPELHFGIPEETKDMLAGQLQQSASNVGRFQAGTGQSTADP